MKHPLFVPAVMIIVILMPSSLVLAQTFTNLHNFDQGAFISDTIYTNNDGTEPVAGMVLSANTLYGTASQGGAEGNGTVFKINIGGSDFTNLYTFTATVGQTGGLGTNSDGDEPLAGLILLSNVLFGVTGSGGEAGFGTVFRINSDGTDFTNLHNFSAITNDGANPEAQLILLNNTLYGTATGGGSSGNGAIFKLNIDGTDYTNIYSFSATSGTQPIGTGVQMCVLELETTGKFGRSMRRSIQRMHGADQIGQRGIKKFRWRTHAQQIFR